MKPKKVAIVCDWLVGGGAEMVVLELHKMFPDAPIYASYCTDEWRKKLDDKVITGWLQSFRALRKFLPWFRQRWFAKLNLSEFNLIISSSGAEAKAAGQKFFKNSSEKPKHISYIHAPTHYYWDRYDEYLRHPGFGWLDPLARFGLKLLVKPMRKWDFKAAQWPDILIANSTHTQSKIKQYYKRDSTVIFPPVDTDFFSQTKSQKRQGFVVVGRQTPYKRFDLAVDACSELGIPLIVIGNGPDHKKLVKKAGLNVTFITDASRKDVAEHLSKAEAFIFPGLDDFGIVAVEAMAAGCPVIAYKAGGALDYVIDKETGLFFDEQTVESLKKTLQDYAKQSFDYDKIVSVTKMFDARHFDEQLKKLIEVKI